MLILMVLVLSETFRDLKSNLALKLQRYEKSLMFFVIFVFSVKTTKLWAKILS